MKTAEYQQILAAINKPKGLRPGQAAMNLLYKLDSRVYAEVCEKDLDCFFLNSVIPDFLEFLRTKIDSNPSLC